MLAVIVVRIEIWPLGSEEAKRELAIAVIGNDASGTREAASYNVWVSHQVGTKYAPANGGRPFDPRALVQGEGVWKRGRVERFRRSLGAVRLVARALEEALR